MGKGELVECLKCVCVWLMLGYTHPVETGGVLVMYLCLGCGGVAEELVP